MSSVPQAQILLLTNSSNQEQPNNGSIVIPQSEEQSNNTRRPYRNSSLVKYMECLKNHATATGGHATDGCGEFMAGGEEGTIEALMCCACNCHRNYHRQVTIQPCSNPQCCPPAPAPAPTPVPAPVTTANRVEEGGVAKKRFRTKFTQEQKEKMHRFAEKSGWKIQKVGDPEVKSFCEEIGIKRKVLKVWMHNNKYHSNKKASSSST